MNNSFLLKNIEDLEDVILDSLDIVERIENMDKIFNIVEKDLKKDYVFHIGNIIFLKETIEKFIGEILQINIKLKRISSSLKSISSDIRGEINRFSTRSFLENLRGIKENLKFFIESSDKIEKGDKNMILEYLDKSHEFVIDIKNFLKLYSTRVKNIEYKEVLDLFEDNEDLIKDNLLNNGIDNIDDEYNNLKGRINDEIYLIRDENNTSILNETLNLFKISLEIIKKNIQKIK